MIKPIDIVEDWKLNYHYGKLLEIIYDGSNLKDDLAIMQYIYKRHKALPRFIYMKKRTITVQNIIEEWNLSKEFADVVDGIYEATTTLQEFILDEAMKVLKEQLEKIGQNNESNI